MGLRLSEAEYEKIRARNAPKDRRARATVAPVDLSGQVQASIAAATEFREAVEAPVVKAPKAKRKPAPIGPGPLFGEVEAVERPVEFFAAGLPKTKGSIRAFIPKGWSRPVLTSMTKDLKPWQNKVSAAAFAEMCGREKLVGAVHVDITFYLPAPKAKKRELPTVRPDLDKLTRAVWDSLKGVVLGDDSQITDSSERKRYAGYAKPVGAKVVVRRPEAE